jgi:hypothetical protein
MTTLRNALLALVLILGLAIETVAQDRYEYATVTYFIVGGTKNYRLRISEGSKFKELKGEITEGERFDNFIAANVLLQEMSEQAWELYNVNTAFSGGVISYYYFLKRKLK